jgi:hypothetical protein
MQMMDISTNANIAYQAIPEHETERRGRAECFALLLHIREFAGPNLGPKTGYPLKVFSWFSSVPPSKCRDSTLN